MAEAAIPVFVIGLYLVQRPQIGSLGRTGALAYAYTFVFFTGTVVYALVNKSANWKALSDEIGVWMTVHGLLMLVAGLAFGAAIIRARPSCVDRDNAHLGSRPDRCIGGVARHLPDRVRRGPRPRIRRDGRGTLVHEAATAVRDRARDVGIDLYRLPLGAGGWLVRFNGRVYERIQAFRQAPGPA